MKRKINFITFAILFLIIVSGVMAYKASSITYDTRVKMDTGAAETNASSTNFLQRFISGFQPVSQYSNTTYSGRFGILGDSGVFLVINFTSPLNFQEVVRGNNVATGEDDKGAVSDAVSLIAKIYNNYTLGGLSSAVCYFYKSSTLLGNAITNSSGDCSYSYDKSSETVGIKNLSVNFTTSYGLGLINKSAINISLEKYVTTLAMGNLRDNGKYYEGDNATLNITIRKSNESVTDSLYDPQNITANATNSAEQLYASGKTYYPGDIVRLGTGEYTVNVTVDYTFGTFVRWDVFLSDDSFASYLGSAVHADKAICLTDWGAWSAWSACVGGTQSRSRTDSSSCTETESQSCTIGDSCFPGYTKILMADGKEKQIKDIEIGEEVLSYDFKNGKIDYAKVLELESPIREGIYKINDFLNVTDEHPFYTLKKNGNVVWSAIDTEKAEEDLIGSELEGEKVYELVIGDRLFTPEGNWIEINSIEYILGDIQTYNLKTVDKYNVFFAEGVLVHNKDGGDTCSNGCSPLGSLQSICVEDDTLSTRTCGNYDSDSCLEWGAWTSNPCEDGETCEYAQCVESNCTPVWECTDWGECFSQEESGGGITGAVITGGVIEKLIPEESKLELHKSYVEIPNIFLIVQKPVSKLKPKDIGLVDKGVEFITGLFKGKESCVVDVERCHLSREKNYQICIDGKKSPTWKSYSCPTGLICSEENEVSCVCSDKNSCDVENERKCTSANKYQICEEDSNGCLKWSKNERCSGGICEEGICILQHCNDGQQNYDEEGIDCGGNDCVECIEERECEAGGEKCENTTYFACDNYIFMDYGEVIGKCGVQEVLINDTEELGEDQFLMNIGDSQEIYLNLGDQVLVTYNRKINESVVLTIKKVKTSKSTNITELHYIFLDGIDNGKVKVTMKSDPVTQDIDLGDTAIFYLEIPIPIGEDDFIQTRICSDIECGLSDRIETRSCELCTEDWDCQWTECFGGDVYTYAYDCVDLNDCGTTSDKPFRLDCSMRPDDRDGCSGRWNCSEWDVCNADYSFDDVLKEITEVDGYQKRICDDLSKSCINKTETRPCDLSIPIKAVKAEWCEEEYVEIVEVETNKLVSRIKQKEVLEFSNFNRVDISFITTEFTGYCDYCFDNIKNYDEEGLDCGGPSCPECVKIIIFFNWLYWLILLLWVLFAILMIIIWRRKKKEEVVKKKSFVEKLKEWVGRRRERAIVTEVKVEGLFKKIIKLPVKILTLPFRISIKLIKREKRLPVEKVPKERVERIEKVMVKTPRDRLIDRLKAKLRI